MNIDASKSALRRQILDQLRQIDSRQRESLSAQARELLWAQPVWLKAQAVLFYAPRKDEVDLWPLVQRALAAGKRVFLPRYEPETDTYCGCEIIDPSKDLHAGRYSIPEPAPHCLPFALKPLDLWLVPGVAFDPLGRRLGRGRGYYDKMLAAPGGIRCGVGFDQQIVSEIPVGPHDARLNCILTPTRWLQI
jgi:5-formyltetrahydrofolate cyclo-ligase